MSARVTRGCRNARGAIDDALSVDELSADVWAPELRDHVAGCADCSAALADAESYFEAMESARTEFADSVGLAPSAWVAIRAGVDEAAEQQAQPVQRIIGRYGLGLGLAASALGVAIVAIVTLTQGGHVEGARSIDAAGLASSRGVAAEASLPAPVLVVAPAALEGGVVVAVSSGDVLRSGDTPRVISVFGRHEVTIAANSQVVVGAWSPRKMTLEVIAGGVRCDVNRASDEDVFEVSAGDVKVTVLGTIFTVEREASGAVNVGVERGKVSVRRGADDVNYVVAGGQLRLPVVAAQTVGPGAANTTNATSTTSTTNTLKTTTVHKAARRHRGGKVIEIVVPDEQMAAAAGASAGYDASEALTMIVGRIRKGDCRSVLKALSTIEGKAKRGQRADAAYLRAWCSQELGRESAPALYKRYLKLDPAARWPVPDGSGAQPPTPRAQGLLR